MYEYSVCRNATDVEDIQDGGRGASVVRGPSSCASVGGRGGRGDRKVGEVGKQGGRGGREVGRQERQRK